VISGFHREVNENCALLGYYAASSGNFFNDVSGHESFLDSWLLNMGPIGCPEKSARNYYHSLRNSPEERSSQACTCLDFLPSLASGTACLGFRMFTRFRVPRAVTTEGY
jgi:hypothetical protein